MQRRMAPWASGLRYFDDPDDYASSVPGGRFGVLPVDWRSFKARLRVTALGDDVSVRGLATSNALVMRSEFIGPTPCITYVLPSIGGREAIVDGNEVGCNSLMTRIAGDTPQLRTFGDHEAGGLTIKTEALRRASAALTGKEHSVLLTTPAAIRDVDPVLMERLVGLHRQAGELLERPDPDVLASMPGIRLMRDEMLAALIGTMTAGLVKTDHRARQLQTASMARIERTISEYGEDLAGLQGLCERTGMALRTVETIIRSRTGMPALTYLHRRRMEFAHNALTRPRTGETVTSIAMRYGFLHLGRFASAYRHVYGELPSLTIARALGRSLDDPKIRRDMDSPASGTKSKAGSDRVPGMREHDIM